MRSLILLVFLLQVTGSMAHPGDTHYSVANIPDALMRNANVVKRTEEVGFDITERNKAKYRRKVAYTIFNEQGEQWAYFVAGYSKLSSIESFEGSLYDAVGKRIKSLKKADINDGTGREDDLADDYRIKWHNFFYKIYPYTVEYEVEQVYKGTMFLREWIPQEKEIMSVQESTLTISTPAINPVRYKIFNYRGEPAISDHKSDKVYTWHVDHLPAAAAEYASPSWYTRTTSVFIATEKFMLGEYEGSYASWEDFGRFIYNLNKDRDVLPDEVKQKVHELINGLKDRREIINKLYEYMQQNTRYISVQLGIGGWQPFDAKYVGTKKYGDCKALSNFMYALLKEAGIKSVYTLTGRGPEQDYFFTDFPSAQFNHAILFVPLGKDTTWLECTSQTLPAGYVGYDNCNRYALAVDENGGTLVRTPFYGMKENTQIRNIKAVLNENGTLDINALSSYSGIQQDEIHRYVNELSNEKIKEHLQKELDFSTYDVNRFEYKELKSKLPTISESLSVTVSNYATITGRRLFILPNVMTRSSRKLGQDSARKFDIQIKYEYKDVDSVEIEIPAGFEIESFPQPVKLSSKFGNYVNSVQLKDNKLNYFRSMEYYSGRFSANAYNELVKFYEAVYKADRTKVVLVRKEQEKKAF